MTKWLLPVALMTFVACTKSEATPDPRKDPKLAPAAPEVTVELAAVTLGDQCGDATPSSPPIVKPGGRFATPPPPAPSVVAPSAELVGDCAGAGCGGGRRHCEQTAMQLVVTSARATEVRVAKVELLGDKGKVLEVLHARGPSRWDGQAYVAWDQRLAAHEPATASYLLSSPDWGKVAGGRWNAHTKKFNVRVHVVVGTQQRTVTRMAITPAYLAPPVPT